MRIGIAGLNALYWPVAAGNYLASKSQHEFVAAASLGEDPETIQECLGLSPQAFADRYGVKLYEQAEEMIDCEKLDAVMLVTRHSQHAVWLERLARPGLHFYVPKTFATSIEEADRMVQVEKQYGIHVASGPSARFLPQLAAVKSALDAGLIGTPFAVRICHHHGVIDVFHAHDWYRDPKEGGPELSLGWYGIDLAMQFTQSAVQSVYARYDNYTSPDSPFMDCGRMVMDMASGCVVSFDMYFCNRVAYPSWQVEVLGPKGVINVQRVANDAQKTLVSLNGPKGYQELSVPVDTPQWEMFWVDELEQGQTPSITAQYAREVTQVSLAARESARTGQKVVLPKV